MLIRSVLNVKHIISIDVFGKRKSTDYRYVPGSPGIRKTNFLGSAIYDGGSSDMWVDRYGDAVSFDSILMDEKYIFNKDENIFYNAPNITITLIGGKYTTERIKYFKTVEEAMEYADQISGGFTNINVCHK